MVQSSSWTKQLSDNLTLWFSTSGLLLSRQKDTQSTLPQPRSPSVTMTDHGSDRNKMPSPRPGYQALPRGILLGSPFRIILPPPHSALQYCELAMYKKGLLGISVVQSANSSCISALGWTWRKGWRAASGASTQELPLNWSSVFAVLRWCHQGLFQLKHICSVILDGGNKLWAGLDCLHNLTSSW